jgi:hypothetical protein
MVGYERPRLTIKELVPIGKDRLIKEYVAAVRSFPSRK